MKILHTGDLHIGMHFGTYPEQVRRKLYQARIETLQSLVTEANNRKCNLFVVAGDMFEGHRVARDIVVKVAGILNGFAGEAVLVLPGNHDYYDESLWPMFEGEVGHKVVVLKETKVYDLEPWGVEADIYPAPCRSRHSETNNLGWICPDAIKKGRISIGVAHGTLEGLSPDLGNSYFPMAKSELRTIGLDLWLLGHAHIRYPDQEQTVGEMIFNAGTPEPDGMNFRGRGSAWCLDVAKGQVTGKCLAPGIFRFLDIEYELTRDFSQLEQDLKNEGENSLVRLTLKGSLEAEVLAQRQEVYSRLEEGLLYLDINDTKLGLRVSKAILEREFSAGSFPRRLLEKLADDSEALQIAYELIREGKSCK